MNSAVKTGAVIAAAGSGERFGEKKQFKQLKKRALLFHTLNPFLECGDVSEIVVVVPEENLELVSRELKSYTSAKPIQAIIGGARRQDSVLNGCLALSDDIEIIAVHDAARPFVTSKLISATIAGCKNTDGCIAAVPSKDTVKKVKNDQIQSTLDRNTIWLAQTPQTFHKDMLIKALQQNMNATDEASMMEALGGKVVVTEGLAGNFKITTNEDWKLAEVLISNNG